MPAKKLPPFKDPGLDKVWSGKGGIKLKGMEYNPDRVFVDHRGITYSDPYGFHAKKAEKERKHRQKYLKSVKEYKSNYSIRAKKKGSC